MRTVIMNAGGMQSDKMWKHIDEFVWSFIFITFLLSRSISLFLFLSSDVCVCVLFLSIHCLCWDQICLNLALYFLLCAKFEYKYFLNIFTDAACFVRFFLRTKRWNLKQTFGMLHFCLCFLFTDFFLALLPLSLPFSLTLFVC